MPIFKRLLLIVLAATFTIAFVNAQPTKPKNPLAGFWLYVADGTKLEVRENGSLTINGEEYVYKSGVQLSTSPARKAQWRYHSSSTATR